MKQYLKALPPWLGSKRAVARDIMRVIRDEGHGPDSVVADAFLGGGGLAMAAKALGYEVHGNDMSPVSVALGKALIENSDRRMTNVERDLALSGAMGEEKIPPKKQLSLPDNCRRLLSRMVAAERKASEDHPAWLLRTWLAKTAITMATWGVPTMAAGSREWDELTPGQAQQLKRTGRPIQIAKKAFEAINAGVHDNGRENTMQYGDAVEFLQGTKADVAYLDPPYPATLSYEQVYVGVNRLIEPDADDTPSEWSAADGWLLLENTFDAAEHISLWVVSMGKGADPERIKDMMEERGRKATWRSLQHRHLPALKKHTDVDGDELLLIGSK